MSQHFAESAPSRKNYSLFLSSPLIWGVTVVWTINLLFEMGPSRENWCSLRLMVSVSSWSGTDETLRKGAANSPINLMPTIE